MVSWIITIWVCGAIFIFMLARVLGGDANFSQVRLPRAPSSKPCSVAAPRPLRLQAAGPTLTRHPPLPLFPLAPQTLGILGYCLLPIIIVSAIAAAVPASTPYLAPAVRAAGVVWASYSAGTLLVSESLKTRRVLLLYPVFLLYVYFVSLHTGA